jgi:hypothetical protein
MLSNFVSKNALCRSSNYLLVASITIREKAIFQTVAIATISGFSGEWRQNAAIDIAG